MVTTLVRLREALEGVRLPLEIPDVEPARKARAEMIDQLEDYVLPRLIQIDAPLLTVVGGSTGAGKSTLVNSLVGERVTETGGLRPTTRAPVLVHNPEDSDWFDKARILPDLERTTRASADPGALQLVASEAVPPGLAILDAPDIDSVEERNRTLAAELLAAADLWLFVTSAARYADQVPWDFLRAAAEVLQGTLIGLALASVIITTATLVLSVAFGIVLIRSRDGVVTVAQHFWGVAAGGFAVLVTANRLAAEFNGHPQIEFMDTMMYGFWGEGHTWPYEGNPFPSQLVAEQTWAAMFEGQLEHWTKVPLATNTQPDFSNVGNSDLLDRTMRTGNWLRTDTIFIENTQIEALSYRPPWAAAICEVGFTTGDPKELQIDEDGITYNEQIISHAADVGVNYLSVWSWHNQSARSILSYYEKFPEPIDEIARQIGYRIRPSFIWTFTRDGATGLVMGLANDGIAPVPGVLRLTVFSEDNKIRVSGCIDAGYPKPTGVHQAMLMLPAGVQWEGLRLKAELEVKGVRYPVRWACRQKVNSDGSLTLRHNYNPDQPLV